MKAKKVHPYYSFDKLLSYNAVWNFAVGGRGIGKTFGAKKDAVNAFIRKGEQFIYLRRYKDELSAAKQTFFADIESFFPDHDLRVNGKVAEIAPGETRNDKKRSWQVIGYFVALSQAQSHKSVSFERVTRVIFDEFIKEKGRTQYLKDETTVMTNFYSTVDRYQDKTRVFFLANSVSIENDYFREYKVDPMDGELQRKGVDPETGLPFIAIHFIDSKDFNNSIYQTRFGKFIKDSEYAAYAVENTFSDSHNEFVHDKDPRARYQYTLETSTGVFSIWFNIDTSEYHVQEKRPAGNERIYTLLSENMSPEKTLLFYNSKLLQYLRTAFTHARVWFDTPTTRNQFIEVFKK